MKKFLVLWISQAFSLFGSAIVEFSLAWYLTLKTGSATVLATAMLVAFLPQIFLGPFIGPLVDRWDRKRTMILADFSISIITLVLVFLFLFELIQVWHIYVAMVLRAIGQSVHFPAMQAATSMIVPEKNLSRSAGLTQMLQGLVTILGPPAGALLLGLLPMQGVMLIDIITFIIAVSIILPMKIPAPQAGKTSLRASFKTEVKQGFIYIWNWKGLAILIGLSAVLTALLVPAFTLLPILVVKHLNGEVLKLGWLESAFGIGMIAGGLILGVWAGFKKRIITSLTGVTLSGISTFGLGFTNEAFFFLGLASSFLLGAGISVANAPIMAVLQSVVAKDMQGRIFSLVGSISGVMTPLGLIIAGPLADFWGINMLFYIAGGLTVLLGLTGFFIRPLMNLENSAVNSDPQKEKPNP